MRNFHDIKAMIKARFWANFGAGILQSNVAFFQDFQRGVTRKNIKIYKKTAPSGAVFLPQVKLLEVFQNGIGIPVNEVNNTELKGF